MRVPCRHVGQRAEVGEPAVALLKTYAKYANYVAIALLVFIVGTSVHNSRKQQA